MRILKGLLIIIVVASVVFIVVQRADHASVSSLSSEEVAKEEGMAKQEIRATIMQFGEQLKNVSLLSPTAASDIEREYGPFVSRSLLSTWTTNPEIAPGRHTSSPWPDHIDPIDIEYTSSERATVRATLFYMTSEEVTHGGDAGSETLSLTVIKEDGTWKINEYNVIRSAAPNIPKGVGDRPQLE